MESLLKNKEAILKNYWLNNLTHKFNIFSDSNSTFNWFIVP